MTIEMFDGDPPHPPPKRKRNRAGYGVIRTAESWRKLDGMARLLKGQMYSFRHFSPSPAVAIDMHGGDGSGVPRPQGDLLDENLATSTAGMLVYLADKIGSCDVVLCEKDAKRRARLHAAFPGVPVLADNAEAAAFVRGKRVFVSNDPCGQAGQSIEALEEISRACLQMDAVIAFNWSVITRYSGMPREGADETASKGYMTGKALYLPMAEPRWWLDRFQLRYFAWSPLIKQSNGFHPRLFVVANHLCDAAKNPPYEVFQR